MAGAVAGTGGTAGTGGVGGTGFFHNGSSGSSGTTGQTGTAVAAEGGALYLKLAGVGAGLLNHVTVVGNSTDTGGGLAYPSGAISVFNSIFWQNTATTFANLNTAGLTVNTDNLINVNPNLTSLQNNGGPTLTMLPNTGSAAIDAGDDVAPDEPTSDQRGLPRDLGAATDIGAVESAYGYFNLVDTYPAAVPPGGDIVYQVTVTLGDSINLTELQGVVSINGFSGIDAVITDVSLPSGWSISYTPNPNGGQNEYVIHFAVLPGVGTYQLSMTVHVDASVTPGV